MPALTPPKQERSRKTLERLVSAALELLSEQGPDGVTVHAVVERADSSVGSFYARFGGKEDLLDYLGIRVWEDARSRWDEAVRARAWASMDLAEIAEGAAGLLSEIGRVRVDELQALERMASESSAYSDFRRHVLRSLEQLLLERRAEMIHEHPDLAVRLGLTAVMGVLDEGLVDGAGEPVPRETLVRECAEILLSYLSGASTGGGGQADFFEVWS